MSILRATGTVSAGPTASPRTRDVGLDILRIVSICGVVAIHVFGHVVGRAPESSRAWWVAVAVDISFVWVVPVFVMISGAVLLGSRQLVDAPSLFYRRRAVRLVPALVAWNLIYLVGVRMWMRGEELAFPRTLQLLVDGTVFTQLYFLWLIVGLYAVAPLLAAFLKAGGRSRAVKMAFALLAVSVFFYMIPGLVSLFGVSRPIRLNILTHWMPYVGYFMVGYTLKDVRLQGWRLAVAGLITAVLGVATVWQYGHRGTLKLLDAAVPVSYLGLQVALLSLGVFVVVLSLCSRLRLRAAARPVAELSNATFGVFLVHLVLFEAIRLQIPEVAAGKSLGAIMAAYAVTLFASFAVSLGARRIPLLRSIF